MKRLSHSPERKEGSVWWKWAARSGGRVEITGVLTAAWPGTESMFLYEGTSLSDLKVVKRLSPLYNPPIWEVKAGGVYYLAYEQHDSMWSPPNVEGFAFGMTFFERPRNDAFAEREVISGERVVRSGRGFMATREFGEPLHAGRYGGRSVWYEWQAPKDGLVTVRSWPSGLSGHPWPGLLGVYAGSELHDLALVASAGAEQTTQTTNRVSFEVTAGEVYVIAVDSQFMPQEFTLELELEPMPMVLSAEIHGRERIVVRVDGAPGSVVIEASMDLEVWEEIGRVEAGGPGEVLVHYGVAPQLFLRARAE